MYFELTQEQASELYDLLDSSLRDMSHEIAATDNSFYRAQLVDRRNLLRAAGESLRTVTTRGEPERVWRVEVIFTEDDERTRADARLRGSRGEWHGWGRAKRNPVDPDVPMVGEELAAARALSDLSHQLLDAAADKVESFEGHPVHLHS